MTPFVTRLHGHRFSFAIIAALAVTTAMGCSDEETLKVHRSSPSTGSYMGGDTVTIHGNGFIASGAKGVKVYFNNRQAPRAEFDGNDKLRVHAPGGEVGEEVDITVVFENGGRQVLKKAFKYVDPRPLQVDDLTNDKDKDKADSGDEAKVDAPARDEAE